MRQFGTFLYILDKRYYFHNLWNPTTVEFMNQRQRSIAKHLPSLMHAPNPQFRVVMRGPLQSLVAAHAVAFLVLVIGQFSCNILSVQ